MVFYFNYSFSAVADGGETMAVLDAPVIRLENVSRHYRLGKAQITAIRNVSLDINRKDFVVIAGPSGSGKTTLLNLVGLIDRPSAGTVVLDEVDTSEKSLNGLFRYRRDKIGYIFQTFNLIPVLSVYENVEYPLILQGVSRPQRKQLVSETLQKVGLFDRRKHKPRELSGGERQRTSIARAVVKKPEIVLADEPTANLDSKTGVEVLELMQNLHWHEGITFIFSSHDFRIIEMGKRVIRLRDGEIESNGET